MEKQRTNAVARWRTRLLNCPALLKKSVFFLCFIICGNILLFSQEKFIAEGSSAKTFVAGSDVEFTLFFPGMDSKNVIIAEPQSRREQGIIFRGTKKENAMQQGGTLVHVWFRFEKEGTYKIDDLTVSINGRSQAYEFESVTITDDFSKKAPRLALIFDDEKTIFSDADFSGQKVVFSSSLEKKVHLKVCVQYASEVLSFSWEHPKNALFSQTAEYTVKTDEISGALLTVAEFEWKSLVQGEQEMPHIRLTATGFAGQKAEISFPPVSILFEKGTGSEAGNKTAPESGMPPEFGEAFLEEDVYQSASKSITEQDCKNLAELYQKEAKSIFQKKKYEKQRRKYEKELALSPWISQKSRAIPLLFLLLAVIFAVMLAYSIIKKKNKSIITSTILIFISVIFLLYFTVTSKKTYGISLGAKMCSIPEENASMVSVIEKGNVVIVKNSSGNWIFVQFGELDGWCKKDEVITWTWAIF